MPPSNKRQRVSKTEEITFDEAARAEWLTGFSKRKAARAKAAQEAAAARDKIEKREAKAELRKQRKEDLERHISEVKTAMRQMNPDLATSSSDEDEDADDQEGEDAEWNGIQDEQADAVVDREDEYVDEDKYTTVTVETVDVGREGLTKRKAPDDDEEEEASGDGESEGEEAGEEEQKGAAAAKTKDGKRVWTKEKPKTDKPKKKKKKFRYESKSDRKVTQAKVKAKKRAQGEKFKARRA
ncbi:nucleolar protein 12-domain-containing protein [Phyllosticta citrichinensis]|uniref:Nucleolar protein 12-domain-containing protein n=1 Tax=Phyllosticta citrichinensis TaxID=1130410 RepID=A0ABR1Y5R8_9PEZI